MPSPVRYIPIAKQHSLTAVKKYPPPDRSHYFTGADYAAACMRCYVDRTDHDVKLGFIKKTELQGQQS